MSISFINRSGVIFCALFVTACADVPETPSKLMRAATAGDLAQIESLIKRGEHPNKTVALKNGISFRIEGRPLYGQTALMFAIEANQLYSVRALLEAGARPDIPDSQGRDSWRRICDAPLLDNSVAMLEEMLASHQPPFLDVCICAGRALAKIELVKRLWSRFEEQACIEKDALQPGELMSAAIALNNMPAVEFLHAEGATRPAGVVPMAVQTSLRHADTSILSFLLQNGFSKDDLLSNGLGVEEVITRTDSYNKAATEPQIRQLLNQY
jgi:hypothetical protein